MECNIYNKKDYGGFWRRIFAELIDGILLVLLFPVFLKIFERLSGKWELLIYLFYYTVIILFLLYLSVFKITMNAIIGYYFLRIKIVSISGLDVTFKQIIMRLISSVISALTFGLCFIWVLFDKNRQAWHDKIAGTYVIKSKSEPIRAIDTPQINLLRTKEFSFLVLPTFLIFAVFVVWNSYRPNQILAAKSLSDIASRYQAQGKYAETPPQKYPLA